MFFVALDQNGQSKTHSVYSCNDVLTIFSAPNQKSWRVFGKTVSDGLVRVHSAVYSSRALLYFCFTPVVPFLGDNTALSTGPWAHSVWQTVHNTVHRPVPVHSTFMYFWDALTIKIVHLLKGVQMCSVNVTELSFKIYNGDVFLKTVWWGITAFFGGGLLTQKNVSVFLLCCVSLVGKVKLQSLHSVL